MNKKLIVIIFSVLMLVGVVGTVWGASIAEAASSIWNSCPRGEVNCAYPGECRSYIDTNNDRICDRSQSDPTLTASASSGSSESSISSSAYIVSADTSSGNLQETVITSSDTDTGETSSVPVGGRAYYFIPVFLSIVGLYALTWILSIKKVIKPLAHRKIWNVILLISSLVCGILGLILTLNVDFGASITLPINSLFWHVETGIAMGAVSIFHILWHWRYFAKMMGVNSPAKT